MAPTPIVQMRLGVELVARLDAAAAAESRSRTEVVAEACLRWLEAFEGPCDECGELGAAHKGTCSRSAMNDPTHQPVLGTDDPPAGPLEQFRCPVDGCPMTFASPKASCPTHGRKAVPL